MSDRNIIDPSNSSSLNGIFTGRSNINVNNITSNNIQTNSITVPTLNTPTVNASIVNASTVNATTLITAPIINASTTITAPSITATSTLNTSILTASTSVSAPTITASTSVSSPLITCPIYKGGLYAFKYLSEQSVPGDLPAYYSITVPFQPFIGFNINNVVVVPSLFCLGNFSITSVVVNQGTNGNIIININMWNNGAANTTASIFGVNCLIYYQE
jgi:hypothetical protein